MSLGILLKQLRSFLLQRTISRKLTTVLPRHCVILTYHRVLPQNEVTDSVEPGMYVTPATLRMHIRFLKNYFDIVSVAQAEQCIAKTGCEKGGKPYCVLTFDDGWLDFYTHAWPVLQEEDVPAVVYLPTALIGSRLRFWTDRLAIVLEGDREGLVARYLGHELPKYGTRRASYLQQNLSRAIETLKGYPYSKIEKILDACERDAGISSDMSGRSFMNWEEVQEIFAAGLVSFGSHTVNHAILTTLGVSEVREELRGSKDKLVEKQVLRAGDISFCYPNGSYTDEIEKQVGAEGYSSAMTCDFGWNAARGGSLLSLKRISLHQDIASTEYLLAYRLVQGL